MKRKKRKKNRVMPVLLFGFVFILTASGYYLSRSGWLASATEGGGRRETVLPSYGGSERQEENGLSEAQRRIQGDGTSLSAEEGLQRILENRELYLPELIELAEKRPEAIDFVLGYPEHETGSEDVDVSEDYTEGEIPLFMQWDKRWGYYPYGDSMIGLSGCGPTCLSMVLVGLTGNTALSPARIADFSERMEYVTKDSETKWALMSEGAASYGVMATVLPLMENRVLQELQAGHPIICSMGPGIFTDTGHFIVLTGVEDGRIIIHDPNSRENSSRTWEFSAFSGQIKNLWAYEKESGWSRRGY